MAAALAAEPVVLLVVPVALPVDLLAARALRLLRQPLPAAHSSSELNLESSQFQIGRTSLFSRRNKKAPGLKPGAFSCAAGLKLTC